MVVWYLNSKANSCGGELRCFSGLCVILWDVSKGFSSGILYCVMRIELKVAVKNIEQVGADRFVNGFLVFEM